MIRTLLRRLRVPALVAIALAAAGFAAFVIDARRDHDQQFLERRGTQVTADVLQSSESGSQLLRLSGNGGVSVRIRVVRPDSGSTAPLRTLLVVGGHRTGSRAVELAGTQDCCVLVAIDYPLDAELASDTLGSILASVAPVRRAALDTVPAISAAVTWLEDQHWVDRDRLELVGVSLGVPFATTAAALDRRIDKLWVVHGAADNFEWLRHNVALRDTGPALQPVYAQVLYWLLYADSFKTGERIAAVAPRPVVVIGAREDERTPAGQTEALFALAGEPKELMWTDGAHVEPDRIEIVRSLLELLQVK
jgi:hypothetical protein